MSMFEYSICEIGGKQYKVIPNHPFEVNFQEGEDKEMEAKVLLISEGGKLKLGNPYLKEALKLERVGTTRGKKIRVAKFHAKANYRRVMGSRSKLTKLIYLVKNSS